MFVRDFVLGYTTIPEDIGLFTLTKYKTSRMDTSIK